MTVNLSIVDWNAVSAISTLLAVIVALFYQPFMNRRKIRLEITLSTSDGIHYIRLQVVNRGGAPIWIVASGLLYQDGDKRVVRFLGYKIFPKKLEPSEMVLCPEPLLEYNYKIKNLYAKDSLGKFCCAEVKEKSWMGTSEYAKTIILFWLGWQIPITLKGRVLWRNK